MTYSTKTAGRTLTRWIDDPTGDRRPLLGTTFLPGIVRPDGSEISEAWDASTGLPVGLASVLMS